MKSKDLITNFEQMIVFLPAICFITIIFSIESIAMYYINHNWLGMANAFVAGVVSIVIMKIVSKKLNTN